MNVSIYVHTGMLPFQRKNEAQAIFLNLLTVCLSFKQKQRNKGKLSICKRTKQTKQTCQSMDISLYLFYQKPAKHSTNNSTFTTNEANFIKYFQVSNTIFQDRPIHGLVEF